MKKEMLPVDLGHLEDKAEAIVAAFDKANDQDRTPEYRAFHLQSAQDIAQSLVNDFRYYFDTMKMGGMVPYGLDEPTK